MKQDDYTNIKSDLQRFFEDWKSLNENININNPLYLDKMSEDIINLYSDAQKLLNNPHLSEDAELIIHLLSTPWGAPFVAKSTLIEAAKEYKSASQNESSFLYLLKDFINYTNIFNNQIYCLLQDLKEDIEHEENSDEKI